MYVAAGDHDQRRFPRLETARCNLEPDPRLGSETPGQPVGAVTRHDDRGVRKLLPPHRCDPPECTGVLLLLQRFVPSRFVAMIDEQEMKSEAERRLEEEV